MKRPGKILFAAIFLIAVLWGVFAGTRYGEFTTYLPFSGRVFAVEAESADSVFVQNGTTGTQYSFETAEEKAWIAARLNELRYRIWFPAVSVATGGWSYRVAIEADGRQYSYTFTANSMTVNGIVYIFPGEQLRELREYIE